MSLAAGTRLGPYEVLGLIGAGDPAFVHAGSANERWRGHAEARQRIQ